MEWYHYIAVFFAGIFLSNAIPHFVSGIMGNKFPSPFSKPPGKGLSSPVLNVVWGSFNILIGYVLVRSGKLHPGHCFAMTIFFIGFILMAVLMGHNFSRKDKE